MANRHNVAECGLLKGLVALDDGRTVVVAGADHEALRQAVAELGGGVLGLVWVAGAAEQQAA